MTETRIPRTARPLQKQSCASDRVRIVKSDIYASPSVLLRWWYSIDIIDIVSNE